MPTKRNRKDSESSNCSMNGVVATDEQNGTADVLNSVTNGLPTSSNDSNSDTGELVCLRPCCAPQGCLSNGQVNLTKPDEIEKIVCSNENCSFGPYMHKDCFTRWEDGLLTYLRSHGRARSWSEKQRRQNLWTKRGYDLAYRACVCSCGRGHLRKDLNWDPKKIDLPGDSMKKVNGDDSTKKKNRKKHKDLPVLGNKYTFGINRTKSKAIPANGKDNRVRTNSASSVLSNDQGYSSSSPSNSEIHGPPGNGFFSPPSNGRSFIQGGTTRVTSSHRNSNSHGFNCPLLHPSSLPQIPDNDVLENFCDTMAPFSTFCEQQSFRSEKLNPTESSTPYDLEVNDVLSPLHDVKSFFAHHQQHHQQQQQLLELQKMMHNLELSQRQRCHSWNGVPLSPLAQNIQSSAENSMGFDFMARQLSAPVLSPGSDTRRSSFGSQHRSAVMEPTDLKEVVSNSLPSFGHWNQPPSSETQRKCCQSQSSSRTDLDMFCQCHHQAGKISEQPQPPLLPFQDFMENATTMLCSDIDLKKPKVIIIPGEVTNNGHKKTCTEISITPMCSTVFHKRYDFSVFQNVLKPSQVNPYHIKMEGEGYGSDDFRNSVLAKLSRAKVSQMNCVTCGRTLPIYDHFPLLDGSLFLSPLRNERRNVTDLKIDIENKSAYLHAVCVGCLDGANNLVCVMCDGKWRCPFHQLGSLYMYDVFAATPCCQSRLCCKHCGIAIVDRRLGLKYFSQYSTKTTCSSCGATDYHFVHPASTFRVLGPDKFPYF